MRVLRARAAVFNLTLQGTECLRPKAVFPAVPPSIEICASSIARPSASRTVTRIVCICRGRSGLAGSSVAM
jgi:hypothetical protein